jgi:hypothetical protein
MWTKILGADKASGYTRHGEGGCCPFSAVLEILVRLGFSLIGCESNSLRPCIELQ